MAADGGAFTLTDVPLAADDVLEVIAPLFDRVKITAGGAQNAALAGCEPLGPPFNTTATVNTPSLRDVANTAPYFHNGAFKTLHEVVQFYNSQSAIAPLNLTGQEIDDLVAYLESL